jgi:phosphotransacetylase
MPRVRKCNETTPDYAPATTPEGQENRMIALAINLAEKQLREGTASSQVITHYLKLGTQKEQLEVEKLRLETKLVEAKTEELKSRQKSEEMYAEAMAAFKRYAGADEVYYDE